ncbi:Adenosine-deaminase (editase) domain [Carpediemonas membranifera]|uniref:tRNA-specific adenosine deaminase 1 n=1 Tax=Carpediemonas membranifera TaxID=201153 RepID=A0A8J6E1B3_9EUKA|nr:Adenosine-deaminase (editase) domain [Carpediemonas membranifera]|eukprot:KAG9392846.1 Adenosine-deaminase (editase) domain [Carpediemonas membranifera]
MCDADDVARCAIDHFNAQKLKDYGLKDGEWTILSAILSHSPDSGLTVLSMACGTKSVPAKLVDDYSIHDGHAEVLCRRGLVHLMASDDAPDLTGHTLHMFVSAPPCGDCAIFDLDTPHLGFNDYRTGSKPVVGALLDRTGVGLFRTKPGRGERSPSMSCSDKLVRWAYLGLLGKRGPPLFLDTLTVGLPADTTALERSFGRLSRLDMRRHGPYRVHPPELRTSPVEFPLARTEARRPSPHCYWAAGTAHEVIVGKLGLPRGVSLRDREKRPSALSRAALGLGPGPAAGYEAAALEYKLAVEDYNRGAV